MLFRQISVHFLPEFFSAKSWEIRSRKCRSAPTFLPSFFWGKKVEDLPGQEPGQERSFFGENFGKILAIFRRKFLALSVVSVVSVVSVS